ncbi:MAG: 16S rRNA (adenine(1518)-N(6)/adenine(1519)-N(6))-dimethyltransferase RsmA [Candidatus Nanopelagicales bacterium]
MEFLTAPIIRTLAQSLKFTPKKAFGQNFVLDANVVRSIVAKSELHPDDVVLEVGPGFGSLTLGLIEKAKSVLAIEINEDLAVLLPSTIKRLAPEYQNRLTVLKEDALKVTTLPKTPTVLVANLPYNVSVPIILHLLKSFPSIKSGLVMVQTEVADRLVASPSTKSYGIPSVKLAWYGTCKKVGDISRNVFWPAPNVDSSLVLFERHDTLLSNVNETQLFTLIDLAFATRRKMLRSALASWVKSDAIFEKAGVDPTLRGEALHVLDFVRLLEANQDGDQ